MNSCQTFTARPQALFSLGQTDATPGALALLQSQNSEAITFLRRHQAGDWGDLEAEDKAANDEALQSGARLLSAYVLDEARLWVITEAQGDDGQRASTCILLPEEY